ncbi:MAG: hypothetical protein LDL30_07190, partial [Desulfovibrio sp.]|nr:hypothetical protein [Desulfovibrio sp.]
MQKGFSPENAVQGFCVSVLRPQRTSPEKRNTQGRPQGGSRAAGSVTLVLQQGVDLLHDLKRIGHVKHIGL